MAKTKAERYREKESRQFLETMYFHEARLSGFTYEQIASLASTHFGRPISARKVATRLNLYRTERIAEDREQLRQIEADRLDRMMTKLDKLLDGREVKDRETGEVIAVDHEDQLKAVTAIIRISERRSKLLGLDAPVEGNLTVTTRDQATAELEEMAREFDESIR